MLAGIDTIYQRNLQLDEHFYDTIIPICIEYLKNMDRQMSHEFGTLLCLFGNLGVQHEGLWAQVEDSVVNKRMFRYMHLRTMCAAAKWMGESGNLSSAVADKFSQVINKHQLSLRIIDAENAIEGFKASDFHHPETLKMLEDGLSRGTFRDEGLNVAGLYEASPLRLPARENGN